MTTPRKLLILTILTVLLVGAALLLFFRATKAPEAARLLPEGDVILYANLRPLHLLDFSTARSPEFAADYKDFIDQTGIQFERDLDEVAMSRRDTADGKDVESSEIFVGRFDQERLTRYLQKNAPASEQYLGHNIFSISHEGHTVRVTLLDATHVAVTNMADASPIHGTIDRSITHSSGPALLHHYPDVPLASVAWLVARMQARPDGLQLPGGISLDFPANAVTVASLRYSGSLLLRADVFTSSEAEAKAVVDSANAHFAIVRSIAQWAGTRGPDADVKSAFESIQVKQQDKVATFTATVPQSVLRKVWTEVSGPSKEGPARETSGKENTRERLPRKPRRKKR